MTVLLSWFVHNDDTVSSTARFWFYQFYGQVVRWLNMFAVSRERFCSSNLRRETARIFPASFQQIRWFWTFWKPYFCQVTKEVLVAFKFLQTYIFLVSYKRGLLSISIPRLVIRMLRVMWVGIIYDHVVYGNIFLWLHDQNIPNNCHIFKRIPFVNIFFYIVKRYKIYK